jgi:hypothetical protein
MVDFHSFSVVILVIALPHQPKNCGILYLGSIGNVQSAIPISGQLIQWFSLPNGIKQLG